MITHAPASQQTVWSEQIRINDLIVILSMSKRTFRYFAAKIPQVMGRLNKLNPTKLNKY
jgi:hypothetical protein